MNACIYCGSSAESVEHWLPRALGNIKNIGTLKERLCAKCNNGLGQELDEELARTGPTGFFKAARGIKGRSKESVSPFLYRGMSAQQPTTLRMPAPHDKYQILGEAHWDAENRRTAVQPLRQLVFKTGDGLPACVPFNRVWNAEQVKKAVQERNLEGAELLEVYLDTDEDVPPSVEIQKLLIDAIGTCKGHYWGGKSEEGSVKTTELGSGITGKYLRAICKVAFHYFLHTTDVYRGDEPEFEPIRRYIRNNDGSWKDFIQLAAPQFIPELREGMVPSLMSHYFASIARREVAFVNVQFFVGPDNFPPPSLIRLGADLGRIESPLTSGHWVKYFGERIDNYDGEIEGAAVIVPN